MRKIISLVCCLVLIFGICGCGKIDKTTTDITVETGIKYRTVTMEKFKVSIEIPKDWTIDMEDIELDLFCTSKDISMGIFGYFTEDVPMGREPEDSWKLQLEADLERFQNVENIEHTPNYESKDKEIKTEIYSINTQDKTELYAYYSFVISKKEPDVLLWISVMAEPEDMRSGFDKIEDIIDSICFSSVDLCETQ